MKGKYVIDVMGLPAFSKLVCQKASELGCEGIVDHDMPTVFANLEKGVLNTKPDNVDDFECRYGLQGYERIALQDFMRLERPTPKVALGLVITDDLDNPDMESPRMVTEADLKEFNFNITRDHVMAAAEQACQALGV